jgi:malonyl-CoA decarboxylase
MFERLKAARTLSSQKNELKKLIKDCHELIKEPGQSVSVGLAARAISRYKRLDGLFRSEFYEALATQYDPDLNKITEALALHKAQRSSETLIGFIRAAEPPRQELFRRLNRVSSGTLVLVQMREEILKHMKSMPSLRAVDADFEHLFSSWFNPGFLELKRLDWMTPAHLLEKVIQHEAVHEIDGWEDLRRRLEPDRRLYAYFHPALPDEPLIFVEVALVEAIPSAIPPLLDRSKPPNLDKRHYKVAAFYSISNCQPGLKGIHLGNFLIKRVAEDLKAEFPSLKTFCTLSPIPSLVDSINKNLEWDTTRYTTAQRSQFESDRNDLRSDLQAVSKFNADFSPELKTRLMRLCAAYLAQTGPSDAAVCDPVAKFHLNNGAILDRINFSADLSPKGRKQSLGIMVNYRYDLDKVEERHEKFVAGHTVVSKEITNLLKSD